MSSSKERSKLLNRLAIDTAECEEVVLEIKHKGITVSEKIIRIEHLKWNTTTGKSDVTISFNELK